MSLEYKQPQHFKSTNCSQKCLQFETETENQHNY